MKSKLFSILFTLVLICSLSLVTAVPVAAADPTTIASGTMHFQGNLTDNGDGTYTGVIAMVDETVVLVGDGEAGYDVYGYEGATAWFGDDPGTGPVWTSVTIANNDAWPTWNPDTPDWYQYSLNLYEEGGIQKWAVRNHPGATAANPWYDTAHWGSEKPPMGVPMSGIMNWTVGYAAETDIGAYLPSTGTGEIPGGAATKGGGPACWDMDWSWGSEVVPLQLPGFDVTVVWNGTDYDVTLTPAPGPVTNAKTGVTYGTIQLAINDASPGDTINVAAGTYNESNVSLPYHSLRIIGAGLEDTIWDGGGGMCINWLGPGPSIPFVWPVTFEISGFTFQSDMPPVNGGMIKLCKVNRYHDIGFGFDFHDNKLITPGNSNYGLWLCRNSGIVRDSVTGESPVKIHNNIFQTTSGICMSNSDNYDIFNNDFAYDTVGNGDATRKNAAIFIGSGCTGDSPSRGGHHIWGNNFAHIGDGYDGTEESFPRGAICIEHYSGQTGLTLLPHTIEYNTFSNSNGAGVHYYCGDDVNYPIDVLRFNNFSGNLYGIYVDGDFADNIFIDAEYNWWGHASGPSGPDGRMNNDESKVIGKGDSILGNVDWDPWLPQPVDHTPHHPVPPGWEDMH
ncbi:MAG: hypothetical protein JSV77_10170 [Dehalococcoidales bacterium]|nr:MAG: hypothetical protein JSV77_10170 [Dehalococcoidales bacterium]